MKLMLVDQQSADLALYFLSDVAGHTEEDITEMAEAIQRLCEDWCDTIEQSVRGRAALSAAEPAKDGA